MQIRFLGTGAAEGIPAIGCDCAHCTRARQEGGKLLRERSAIVLQLPGYNVLVEAPPDIRSLINKYPAILILLGLDCQIQAKPLDLAIQRERFRRKLITPQP